MKIICDKANLQKSISIALRSVPSHTTMPIMECIMINAEDGMIRFTTNDMELGIETMVPGLIEESGAVAINAKMFSEIIRRLPDEEVTMTVNENMGILITCGKAKFNLGGMSGNDFTYLPEVEREDCITMSQLTLKEMISKTIFSIAASDNNRIMTGELFKVSGDVLEITALDGHRVAIRKELLKESYSDKQVIVPGKTLSEISKILSDSAEDEVGIYITDNHITFVLDETTVVSRLIEGEYFKIDNMLAMDHETKVICNRRELLSAIDRSTLFVRENDKKPIIFDVQDGFMKLSIESVAGSMDEDLDIDKEGKDILIGFNPKFMIDALRAIDDETVSLAMISPKSPCFIRDEDGSYIYLVLPVNFVR